MTRKKQITIRENESKTFEISPDKNVEELNIIQKAFSQLNASYKPKKRDKNKNTDALNLKLKISLEEGASLNFFMQVTDVYEGNFQQEVILAGEGSSCEQRTLFICKEGETINISSKTFLEGKNTRAKIVAKGVLKDSATANFDGEITVGEKALNSDANLTEHMLLLSPKAKIRAVPGLKIFTNEVRASHSSSITRINEDQLFYAYTRGISEKQATKMITKGFIADMSPLQSSSKSLH